MQKPNYTNEKIKREFFSFLKDSEGFSEESIDSFEKSILFWEEFSEGADLSKFNKEQAVRFKNWLVARKKKNGSTTISLSYCYDTLRHLRRFFEWLSRHPDHKSEIDSNILGYLSLSKKESRIATHNRQHVVPTLEEVKKVLESIEGKTEVARRDRALISLVLLTGARITAISSLPMKCFDHDRAIISQDPKLGVKTKFSKQITTALFEIDYANPRAYFLDWYDYLANERHFSPDNPIFPATKREQGSQNVNFYSTEKIEPLFWKNSSPARKVFEKRFKQAGVPYYHPHSLRHLIVKELIRMPLTEEEKKAISQNLGHENVETTFGTYGYGQINEDRQVDLIRSISFRNPKTQTALANLSPEVIKELALQLKTAMDESPK